MGIISNISTNLESALAYSSLGYKVFPIHGFINGACTCCKSPCPDNSKPGKHPACRHGYKDASLDASVIRDWFEGKPWLNLAIAPEANQVVLDVDVKSGGMATLASWETEHGVMPATPKVKTGSGGRHFYFRLPDGVKVKNLEGVQPGIDTRSFGGYVIAPHSLHSSGNRYEWLVPLDTPLAQAPAWLIALIGEKAKAPAQASSTTKSSGSMFGLVREEEPCDFASHPGSSSGDRHKTLLRLTGIHLNRGDSLKSIEAMAIAWGGRCEPAYGQSEVLKQVNGLWRKEEAKQELDTGKEEEEVCEKASGTDGMERNSKLEPKPEELDSIHAIRSGMESNGMEVAGELDSIHAIDSSLKAKTEASETPSLSSGVQHLPNRKR